MPGSILAADTNFPNLEGKGSMEEKLTAVSSYLYLLLESLRYTLSNLSTDNFNDTELALLSQTLTQPVELRIKDVEGNVAELVLSADKLTTSVKNAEGAASQAQQTAESLTLKFQTQAGEITTLKSSVNGLNISQKNGGTTLSGVSLYFYDGATREAWNGKTIGYESGLGNIVGQMSVDDKGSGTTESAKYRMFVGTGRGLHSGNEFGYPLKLESAGDSNYSAYGNIYIQAGSFGNGKDGNGNQYVSIGVGSTDNNTTYTFYPDGIYCGGKKIVDSTKAV